MMAIADQEELNYLFSDSLSDADLLRAVESIESAQACEQTSSISDNNRATTSAESYVNVGTMEPPQHGMLSNTFKYMDLV